MNLRDHHAALIRAVYGLDPETLTPEQFDRAVASARRTERGQEISEQHARSLSDEELENGMIEIRFGIDPARLTPQQRQRLLDRVDAELDAIHEGQGL